jgi:oxamate amidohydrolase
LLADAIDYAEDGYPVTLSQAQRTRSKIDELRDQPGFAGTFLRNGAPPDVGVRFTQKTLGETLRMLARDGFDAFYRGDLAERIAKDLADAGSPLTLDDLRAYSAQVRAPLHLRHELGDLYNTPPPTQGLVSLVVLALLERLGVARCSAESAEYLHLVIEATKRAFLIRDRYITDPAHMEIDTQACLSDEFLAPYTQSIRADAALAWNRTAAAADTVWMGAIDGEGRAVSFLQSLYHEFGSGVVLPSTGVLWQDRGCSFSLDPRHVNVLAPGKIPFHTLNPALARLNDGRIMVFGTMGGDGQPQTQAAIFTRYAYFGQRLQSAIAAPRWLLGRTWGASSVALKIERRFPASVVRALESLGHEIELVGELEEMMGHAGAIVRYPDGRLEAGSDPRSDGSAAAY